MAAYNSHIAMYPWFALGHLSPFLQLSNKLAKKGNRISFIAPSRTIQKLEHLNRYPELITFVPITVPHVEGLPPGAETTSDVPNSLHPLIMTAMDLTENDVEALLLDLKPDIVFFDFTHWIPGLTRKLGIKSIYYCASSSAMLSYSSSPPRHIPGKMLSEEDLMQPPLGYPEPSIRLHSHEARNFAAVTVMKFGSDLRFCDRHYIGLCQSDALAFRTCREIEGPYINYLESQFSKPVFLSGPIIPEPSTTSLEEKWRKWLEMFKHDTVIYCAFGSECTLEKDQFQELLLGLELTCMPFLAALKPPLGASLIKDALPKGFEDRVGGRGVVHGGWVQQQKILEHPSVGCFVTHCGSSSLAEALVNKCQLVLLPHVGDQIINARMMSKNLKVGIEVDKEDNGFFTKESVCRAVRTVMEEANELGRQVRVNHAKFRHLLNDDLESSYIDKFREQLKNLCDHSNLDYPVKPDM